MTKYQINMCLYTLLLLLTTVCLYAISAILWQVIILGVFAGTANLVYFYKDNLFRDTISPETILKINSFLMSDLAVKVDTIILKNTTNKYYTGYIDMTPVYENGNDFITLKVFKEQLSLYASLFGKEIKNCPHLYTKFMSYEAPLFYIDADNVSLLKLKYDY